MKPRMPLAMIPLLAATLLTWPLQPAAASQVDTTFDDFFGIFRQAFEDAQAYLEEVITGHLDHLPGNLDGVIHTALGELGLVDPNQMRSELAAELTSTLTGDLAHTDGVYAGIETANEVDRLLTRVQVDTVLSQEGQTAMGNKITWLENTVGQVQQRADSAQVAVSTQEAIKQMAQQSALESEVLGAVHSELLNARQDAQLTNLNLSNISQSLDQETRARRLQGLGDALETLQISSQARLF